MEKAPLPQTELQLATAAVVAVVMAVSAAVALRYCPGTAGRAHCQDQPCELVATTRCLATPSLAAMGASMSLELTNSWLGPAAKGAGRGSAGGCISAQS